VKDVAAGQAEFFLQVNWSQGRVTEDAGAKAGRVRFHRREDEVHGALPFLMPVAVARQFVGKMLTAMRGDVSCFP